MLYVTTNNHLPLAVSMPIWGRPQKWVAEEFARRHYVKGEGETDQTPEDYRERGHIRGEGAVYWINAIGLSRNFVSTGTLPSGEPLTRLSLSKLLDAERERFGREINQGNRDPKENWASYLWLRENDRRAGNPPRLSMGKYPYATIGDETVVLIGIDHYNVPYQLPRGEIATDCRLVMSISGIDEVVQEAVRSSLNAGKGSKGYDGNLTHFGGWKKAHEKPVDPLGIVFEGVFGLGDWTGHYPIMPSGLARQMKFEKDGKPKFQQGQPVVIDPWYVHAYQAWDPRPSYIPERSLEKDHEKLEDIVLRENVVGMATVNTADTARKRPDLVMAGHGSMDSQTSVWTAQRTRDDERVQRLIMSVGHVDPDKLAADYAERERKLEEKMGNRWIRDNRGLLAA